MAMDTAIPEPRHDRHVRHRRRVGLYLCAFALVAVVVLVCALVVANTRAVKVDLVIGSFHVSLIWIILASVIFGWVAGIVTGIVFRRQTRRLE